MNVIVCMSLVILPAYGNTEADSVINLFVDRHLTSLWSEAEETRSCVQRIPSRVFTGVGKSSARVTTSDATTGFLCRSKRRGDVDVQRDSDHVVLRIPLGVDNILFSFQNVKIVSSDPTGQRELGRVDFTTDGVVSLEIKMTFPQNTPGCKTDIDVDVTKINDFNCFVQGDRHEPFENWINSNMKSKFSTYMEKQYFNFFDRLDICNYLTRSLKTNKEKDNSFPDTDDSIDETYEDDD